MFPQPSAAKPLTAAKERALKPKDTFKECDDCPLMVVLPAGEYMMGSPPTEPGHTSEEAPQHKVRIAKKFAVGKYEVTVDQFEAFVKARGHTVGDKCSMLTLGSNMVPDRTWKQQAIPRGDPLLIPVRIETDKNLEEPAGPPPLGLKWVERPGSFRNPGFSQGGSHPVVCVSWPEAKASVNWLSKSTSKRYRLLSESEWEYAARAGTRSRYHFGDDERDLCRYANGADTDLQCSDGYAHTAPIGQFASNAFDLHDVHGNVWEWVEDCGSFPDAQNGYASAPADGTPVVSEGLCFSRSRGGAYTSGAKSLRAASRNSVLSGGHHDDTGFRVARTVD